MSKIEERLKALKEQEERLRREEFKVQFLQHILDETKGNKLPQFKTVKDDILSLLQTFIDKAIEAIETESTLVVKTSAEVKPVEPVLKKREPVSNDTEEKKPQRPVQPTEANTNDKLSFAMDNCHLSGQKVKVHNPENPELPYTGEVVGLDAPHVVIRTDNGPVIKVPLDKVIV